MRCPLALWKPVPNETPRAEDARPLGLVLHVTQGGPVDPWGWFDNPASQVSSHFWGSELGALEQYVDTADKAWAEVAGNAHWLSIELAGFAGSPATPAQVATVAALYGWGRAQFGWPLQSSDDPGTPGLGWHGMGGAAWGGHTGCPGAPILAQRPAMLALAGSVAQFRWGNLPPVSLPTPPALLSTVEVDAMNLEQTLVPAPGGHLDANGRGWAWVPIDPKTVTGATAQGSNPGTDGYWPPVVIEWQPRTGPLDGAGKTTGATPGIVVTFAGQPGQSCAALVSHLTV